MAHVVSDPPCSARYASKRGSEPNSAQIVSRTERLADHTADRSIRSPAVSARPAAATAARSASPVAPGTSSTAR